MVEKKRKAMTKKETTQSTGIESWKIVLVCSILLVAAGFYFASTTIFKDKELRNKCQEVQTELRNSPSFQQCGCSPTPADAFDPDYAEEYNKTERGCTCNCVLADGTRRSFDIRIAK